MWNRVALLAAGLGFGWTLVHVASAPFAEFDKHRARAVVALVAAAAVIALLAAQRLAAGILGLMVFLLSAVVGYISNARQISRNPVFPLLEAPRRGAEPRGRVGVVFLVPGEPAVYEGPAFWARWARDRGEWPRSGWYRLVFPWALARIRRAYGPTSASGQGDAQANQAAAELQARLGDATLVRPARLWASPDLSQVLLDMVDDGFRRVLVLNGSGCGDAAVWDAVSASRVREGGVLVSLVPVLSQGDDWIDAGEARLHAYWAGRAPGEALQPRREWIEAATAAIADALADRDARVSPATTTVVEESRGTGS